MASTDYFGLSDTIKTLEAPEGFSGVHQAGYSWAVEGQYYQTTTKVGALDWNRIIAQFRGLFTIDGVDLSDLGADSPFVLREALTRSVTATLAGPFADQSDALDAKVTEAEEAADTAVTAAGTATTKAGEASESADIAVGAAGTATTKAGEASDSADIAVGAAGTATTKAAESLANANAAGLAQVAAETARDATLTAFDDFDDTYLGAFATPPTTDNDGDPLQGGALYFDTSAEAMKLWTGSAWVAAYISAEGVLMAALNLSDIGDAAVARGNLGLGNVNNTSDAAKPVSTATQTALDGKSNTGHTHAAATTGADGFMSSTDKTKLNGIATGANATPELTDGDVLAGTSTTKGAVSPAQMKAAAEMFGGKTSFALISDNKPDGTAGGTFNSGARRTRDLNTIDYDPDAIVSLSSNQFTLQAGTYRVLVDAPAYAVDNHRSFLRNVTDGVDVKTSNSAFSSAGYYNQISPFLVCELTIASAKTFEVQHQCAASRSSEGFGRHDNMALGDEIYSQVQILKVA